MISYFKSTQQTRSNLLWCLRFDDLMAVKVLFVIFWVVMPCGLEVLPTLLRGYVFLQNIGNDLQDLMIPQHTRSGVTSVL
jgi:hypothetical protein